MMHWLFIVVVLLAATPILAQAGDNGSDTWVGTDHLGRTLPTHEDVGEPRPNRFVGIFYFLWLGQHGQAGPFNNSEILRQDPAAMDDPDHPLWGPPNAYHHWGEPLFGYYVSNDEWVIRKHAQMLADAGVDTLIFDVTNGFIYQENFMTLCRVFEQVRKDGGRTPQIAFLAPFGDPTRVVERLYEVLYKPGLHEELWFRWEGKPLIMADPNVLRRHNLVRQHDHPAPLEPEQTLGQTFEAPEVFTAVSAMFGTYGRRDTALTLTIYRDGPDGERVQTRRFTELRDNDHLLWEWDEPLSAGRYYLEASRPSAAVAWWSHSDDIYPEGQAYKDGEPSEGDRIIAIRIERGAHGEILDFFTWRKPIASYFGAPRGPEEWGWLDVYPQRMFYKYPGVPEQMTVGVAQNAVDGRLSVLSNPRAHGRSFHNGRQPRRGQYDDFGRNFQEQWERALDFDPAFIFVTGWNEWVAMRFTNAAGRIYGAGPVAFMDVFDQEFSRDAEPMAGGHLDAYYMQLVANVRRYKGARPLPVAGPAKTIALDGGFEQWRDVTPEFRDDIGDTMYRDHPGWGEAGPYVDRSGRNDIVAAKVARDDEHMFFYLQTREPIRFEPADHPLRLLIDVDGDRNTGWEGYDFIVEIDGGERFVLKRWSAGAWQTVRESDAMHLAGNELSLRIPRGALPLRNPLTFDFKWTDNIPLDIMSFYTTGDAAPNGRFSYRYITVE